MISFSFHQAHFTRQQHGVSNGNDSVIVLSFLVSQKKKKIYIGPREIIKMGQESDGDGNVSHSDARFTRQQSDGYDYVSSSEALFIRQGK